MQMPVFLTLFLAPVYVPLDLLTAGSTRSPRVNPATFLLEAGRGLFAGEPTEVRRRPSRSRLAPSRSFPSGRCAA